MTESSGPVPHPRDHREFDLPAQAYDVAVACWPRCDEHQLWAVADDWYAVAESADATPHEAAERAHRAAAGFVSALGGSGAAATEFTAAWQEVSADGDPPPAVLRAVGGALGGLADRYGRDVEAAKIEAWIELGRLAIEMVGMSVGATLGEAALGGAALGGAAPVATGHLAANRTALQRVFRRLAVEVDPQAPAAVLRAVREKVTPQPAGPPPIELRRRAEVARYFRYAARQQHDLARDAAAAAADARRDGLSTRAGHFDLISARAAAGHAEGVRRARMVSDGDPPDHGPVGGTGPTITGGLREPLPVHEAALHRALPRDGAGRLVRRADPRVGEWFALLNADGPGADPTRAVNDSDVVLALYDTYLLGRPRVAAPRTFDGYAAGEPDRPLGGETGGCARIEATTGGRFQSLCPDVGGRVPPDARQAVEHAVTHLHRHLSNCGPGAFAFVAARAEGGTTHLWVVVNHDGTILHLDPQTGLVVEGDAPYPHTGRHGRGNLVLMDALVVDGHGRYTPMPYLAVGAFGARPAPGDPERVLLAEHVARLRHRVAPTVLDESTALARDIGALTGITVPVTLRIRSVDAILDEVERSATRRRAGDPVDAVSVRLLVPDARTLAVALARTRLRFRDRVRTVHDPQIPGATRAPTAPAVRVVVSVRVDDRPYEFALRLVTERTVDAVGGPPVQPDRPARHAVSAARGGSSRSDVEATLAEGSR